jgi:hypothetical protein
MNREPPGLFFFFLSWFEMNIVLESIYAQLSSNVMHKQGRTGSLNFGVIFFRGAPKKCSQNENADQKKKKKKVIK